MLKTLVLGAGYVSHPLADYLVKHTDFELTVADISLAHAERVTQNRPRTTALEFDIHDTEHLNRLVASHHIVVSLLPYQFHAIVAQVCIRNHINLVTASYASPEISALDKAAREAGIVILMEMGLDPGIDHMSAMRMIDQFRGEGAKVTSFKSYCGGIPSPEACTNPWDYKFSWSPQGVIRAAKNDAFFLQDGERVCLSNDQMLTGTIPVSIDEYQLEAYPNRNSLQYIDYYKLAYAKTMIRYTLRYPGWVASMAALTRLGLLNEHEIAEPPMKTVAGFVKNVLGISQDDDVLLAIKQHIGNLWTPDFVEKISWLGLADSQQMLPRSAHSPFEMLTNLMSEKMQYAPRERDAVVLFHDFEYEKNGKTKRATSTMVQYGDPNGASIMAKTVALPTAIATRMLLEKKLVLQGVHIPIIPEIYHPVLDELEQLDIVIKEMFH